MLARTRSFEIGTRAGVMIASRVSACHSTPITFARKRSTPRVRWNFSSVAQSFDKRSNSSGWIG